MIDNKKSNSGNNWTKTIQNSDGSYDSFKWSLDKEIGSYMVGNLAMIVFGAITCILVPIFVVFVYVFPTYKDVRIKDLRGVIVICIFTLLDYFFGIYGYFLFSGFPEFYESLAGFMLGLIVISAVLITWDDEIYEGLYESRLPFLISWSLFGLFLYFGNPILSAIVGIIGQADTSIWITLFG